MQPKVYSRQTNNNNFAGFLQQELNHDFKTMDFCKVSGLTTVLL